MESGVWSGQFQSAASQVKSAMYQIFCGRRCKIFKGTGVEQKVLEMELLHTGSVAGCLAQLVTAVSFMVREHVASWINFCDASQVNHLGYGWWWMDKSKGAGRTHKDVRAAEPTYPRDCPGDAWGCWSLGTSSPVASFTKEVNPRLAKRPLVFNGLLVNRGLTSLVKEATGLLCVSQGQQAGPAEYGGHGPFLKRGLEIPGQLGCPHHQSPIHMVYKVSCMCVHPKTIG